MLSYTRGILVAYRDVLTMIENLNFDSSDIKVNTLKDFIAIRIENYIDRQVLNNDID